MMEDDLWWKTTYHGRRLWKTTYHGRQLMMEDDLWWKATYHGRRPIPIPIPILMGEGDFWWSVPSKEFSPRRPYVPLCVIFFQVFQVRLWCCIKGSSSNQWVNWEDDLKSRHPQKWRRPQNKDDLKNEDDINDGDDLINEENPTNGDM